MRVIIPFFYFFGFPNASMKYQDSSYHLMMRTEFDSCFIEFYQAKDSLSLRLINKGSDTISFKHGVFVEQTNDDTSFSFNFYMDSVSLGDTINGRTVYHLQPHKSYQFDGIKSKIQYTQYGTLTDFYWFLEIGRYRKKFHKIKFR